MISKILIIGVLTVIGFIVGLNVETTSKPIASVTTGIQSNTNPLYEKINTLQLKIDQMHTQMNRESLKQNQLQQQIIALADNIKRLQNLEQNMALSTETPHVDENLNSPDVEAPHLSQSEKNKQILVSMGVDDETADLIQHLSEKKEMDQLYLRNTASREGWFGTEKYFEKTRELNSKSNIYRDSLGDDKYDQFLFSSQMTNRIAVQSVLADSPAEIAGLQTGDYILSYANKRVFNWSDLTSLTADGEVGENISIEIQRNNEISQLYIVRGPMGVRLDSKRIEPNASN